jgi:nucleotide-binding universal stress UspA family protein
MAHPASILFAYDGSEQARHAIREAADQLSPGRRGTVLTVWEPLAAHLFAASAAAWGMALDDDLEIEAGRTAEKGARLATSVGFDATPLTENGAPIWQAIVSCAGRVGAGIVVMGSHGRTGIGLVLMGSVAEAVSRHAEQPVLIVH